MRLYYFACLLYELFISFKQIFLNLKINQFPCIAYEQENSFLYVYEESNNFTITNIKFKTNVESQTVFILKIYRRTTCK